MGKSQAKKKTAHGSEPRAGNYGSRTGGQAPKANSSTVPPSDLMELHAAIGGSGLYCLLALTRTLFPLSRIQIGRETGFDQEAVRRAIGKLKPCGLILEIPDGQWPKYHATAVARQLVLGSGAAALAAAPSLLPGPTPSTEGNPQWGLPSVVDGRLPYTEGKPSLTEAKPRPTRAKPQRGPEEEEHMNQYASIDSGTRANIFKVLRAGGAFENALQPALQVLVEKHPDDFLQRALACLAFSLAPTTNRGDRPGATFYPLVRQDLPIPDGFIPPTDLPFEQQLAWAMSGGPAKAEALEADIRTGVELEPAETGRPPTTLEQTWERALTELRLLLPSSVSRAGAAFDSHITPARLVATEAGVAHVHAAHSGSADWLRTRVMPQILQALIAAGCQVHQVVITCA